MRLRHTPFGVNRVGYAPVKRRDNDMKHLHYFIIFFLLVVLLPVICPAKEEKTWIERERKLRRQR